MKQQSNTQIIGALLLATALSSCGTNLNTSDAKLGSGNSPTLDGSADINANITGDAPNNTVNPALVNDPKQLSAGNGFALVRDLNVNVLGVPDGSYREFLGRQVKIPIGTDITVLETKMDAAKGLMLRLGIDADEDAGLPPDIWVLASDIPEGILVAVEDADYNNDENIAFSPNDSVSEMARKARKKMTYCYRFIKQYLIKTGKVNTYLPGSSAFMAASTLPKYGFKKTGHSPATAVEGEICVYRGGRGGNGHIEIKRGGKWWYGYGFKSTPITHVNHALIGCYAK